jgi:DNA-binding GntR family transcriptional regulator
MARRLSTVVPEAIASSPEARVPPLVLQIADTLIADIIAGRYKPGERVREQEIANRLGVSRGPVREALRLCEQDGMVEVVPWRGAKVVELRPAEVDDLFEVLSALMGLVARLAASHAENDGLAKYDRLVTQMENIVAERGDLDLQLQLSFEAGVVLRKQCGSPRAGQMLMRVGRLAYWQHRYLLSADLQWRRRSVAKFRKLVAALIARDGAKAETLSRDIVHQSKLFVLEQMATASKITPPPLSDLPLDMRLQYQAATDPV